MGSYFDGMLRYFELSGRSTRMQYWMFFLIQFVLLVLAVVADYQLGGFAHPKYPQAPLTLFVIFVHAVPAITVSVRRLHDIGKSGAWYLLNFVPFGGVVLLFWACCASEPGRNIYDDTEPSRYEPRGGRPARQAQTTIPRAVRMGSGATRPPSPTYDGLSAPERFI
ncbi:DUF805 domain-containing protein [Devosia oryziradicis]|uniref:DUF805 domain-containing protein n=1 Tax=Devosia oryziradicis TaxID=2801335 RepID=A0ABX7BVW8_9HYPH|nr:DUF805 domain-containing protein [Devosia oryziradicis]QQR35219.1 DUF805 domain-containing protein [Devosia oryziradicis]